MRDRCCFVGCKSPAGDDGVCNFHREKVEASRTEAERRRLKPWRPRGYVYAIEAESGHIKIGFSVMPEFRLQNIQSCCPIGLRLMGHIEAEPKVETAIHKTLKKDNHQNEWFHPTEEVRKAAALISSGNVHAVADWLEANGVPMPINCEWSEKK